MAQHDGGKSRSRQDVFALIDEKFQSTRQEELAELRREAKARAEEQRRKDALLAQMSPGSKHPEEKKAKTAAQQTPSSKKGRPLQASVESDTEESPGTKSGLDHPKKANPIPRKEDVSPPPVPKPRKEPEPPPSLEKREGGYSHAPPLKFAREQVVTSTLCMRPPRSVSSARQCSGRSKKGVAVWYGDEVRIVEVDPEDPHRALPRRVRPHRRTV